MDLIVEFRRRAVSLSRVASALCGRSTMTFPWSMLREQSRSSIVNRDGARLSFLPCISAQSKRRIVCGGSLSRVADWPPRQAAATMRR